MLQPVERNRHSWPSIKPRRTHLPWMHLKLHEPSQPPKRCLNKCIVALEHLKTKCCGPLALRDPSHLCNFLKTAMAILLMAKASPVAAEHPAFVVNRSSFPPNGSPKRPLPFSTKSSAPFSTPLLHFAFRHSHQPPYHPYYRSESTLRARLPYQDLDPRSKLRRMSRVRSSPLGRSPSTRARSLYFGHETACSSCGG